ncbi:hypothetical protein OIU78_026584, partial [Salix suchowensis]
MFVNGILSFIRFACCCFWFEQMLHLLSLGVSSCHLLKKHVLFLVTRNLILLLLCFPCGTFSLTSSNRLPLSLIAEAISSILLR